MQVAWECLETARNLLEAGECVLPAVCRGIVYYITLQGIVLLTRYVFLLLLCSRHVHDPVRRRGRAGGGARALGRPAEVQRSIRRRHRCGRLPNCHCSMDRLMLIVLSVSFRRVQYVSAAAGGLLPPQRPPSRHGSFPSRGGTYIQQRRGGHGRDE